MKSAIKVLLAVVIMVGAGAAGFYAHRMLTPAPEPVTQVQQDYPIPMLGQRRPDFVLPDLQAESRQMSEWDGKLVVINFWATWCPPCREEIPYFITLQSEYAEQGLQFIGIALQEADEVRDYAAKMKMNYPILTGYREVIKIAEALGNDVNALPYTVVIDQDGVVVFTRAGPIDEASLRRVLEPYLQS